MRTYKRALFIVITLILTIYSIIVTKPSHHDIYQNRMKEEINCFRGNAGVYVKSLRSGQGYYHRPKEIFPAGGCARFIVLVELYYQHYEKRINLENEVHINKSNIVDDGGFLEGWDERTPIRIKNLAQIMLLTQDDTAFNQLVDILGIDNINQRMKSIGLRNTRIAGKMPLRSLSDTTSFSVGYTTPEDIGLLLEKIISRQIIDKASCCEIEGLLSKENSKTRIARYINKNDVVHITNLKDDFYNDIGFVRHYNHTIVICIFTKDILSTYGGIDNEPELFISKLSKITNTYYMKNGKTW